MGLLLYLSCVYLISRLIGFLPTLGRVSSKSSSFPQNLTSGRRPKIIPRTMDRKSISLSPISARIDIPFSGELAQFSGLSVRLVANHLLALSLCSPTATQETICQTSSLEARLTHRWTAMFAEDTQQRDMTAYLNRVTAEAMITGLTSLLGNRTFGRERHDLETSPTVAPQLDG